MKKRILVLMTMISMELSLLVGCGDSRQTEEVLVTPKDEVSEQSLSDTKEQVNSVVQEKQSAADETKEMLSSEAESEGIRQQVQAPERFQAEISEGGISITADAEIFVPKAPGFHLYQVKARPFVQEDYDRVSQVLLQGASLWRAGDKKAMEELFQEYRASLEAQQAALETKIAAIEEEISLLPEGSEQEESILTEIRKEYEQAIIVLQKESELSAPEADQSVWVVVPDIVPEDGELSGVVKVEGEQYYVNLNNTLKNDKKQYSFEVVRDGDSPGEYVLLPDGRVFSDKNLDQTALELIKEMGLDDMDITSSEYVVYTNTAKCCFCVHFTRVLQDIPVTYTSDMGDQAENYGSIPWTYERIDVLFDEQGLYNFIWYSPYQLMKQSEEYVILLPFSDIQDIFIRMMLEKYKDYPQPGLNLGVDIAVQEVRLGYMRVREDGRERKGTMIPVWDFFGTRKDISFMTINAMDGTIIDRELGY